MLCDLEVVIYLSMGNENCVVREVREGGWMEDSMVPTVRRLQLGY